MVGPHAFSMLGRGWFGEELQDAVRRILLCAARRDPRAFLSVYRHANTHLDQTGMIGATTPIIQQPERRIHEHD